MSQVLRQVPEIPEGRGVPLPRRLAFAACAAVGFAALYDGLFYRHEAGFTVGAFLLALEFLLVIRSPGVLRKRSGWIMAAATVGLAAAMIISPSTLAYVLSAMAVGMLAILGRNRWVSSVAIWVGRGARLLLGVVVRPVVDATIVLRHLFAHPRAVPRVLVGVVVWVLPVALSMVFLGLFALANPVIGEQARHLGREIENLLRTLPEWLTPERILQWVIVLACVWALLRARPERTPRVIEAPPRLDAELLSPRMIVRCLAAFNMVFALQSAMDIAYLYAGARLPEGMTYASYAHRGAYPLVATALLAGLFVIVTFRTGGSAQRSGWARGMVYLWIAQNIFLMISTIWRLALYVGAYGLTYWRVSTIIWVVMVGAGFMWIILRIALLRGNAWLMHRTLATAGAILFACCFVNFPRLIADFNVRHCAEVSGAGVPLDVGYLEELGPQAIPALDEAMPVLSEGGRLQAISVRRRLAAALNGSMSDWRGWTWRNARLADELNAAVER